jgi:iron complex transport system ATP-binding protein
VIALERVAVERGGRPVLVDVDLRLDPGAVVGLIGPNGAGKSSLLRVIAGHDRPARGDVRVGGAAPADADRASLARDLAWLPQTASVPFAFTVRELVSLGRSARLGLLGVPSRADRAIVDGVLEELGLEALAGRAVPTLSGGERQRALLGMVLAQQARAVLLDEPTSAQDYDALGLTARALRRRADAGALVVVATHDVNLALRLCDAVAVVAGGRLLGPMPPRDLLARGVLEATWPGAIDVDPDGLRVAPALQRTPSRAGPTPDRLTSAE